MGVIKRLAAIAAATALVLSAVVPAEAASHGSVTIKRDEYGNPNIYADDTYSLFYGWGYALAQDRLFQIESVRRAAEGRAAEVFGPDYLERDRQMLVNYDPDSLKPQLAKIGKEHRLVLDGMVAGINKRIDEVLADRAHKLPKQFADYGFAPQHWSDLDIAMSWCGLLLFAFSDYTSQISNAALLSDLEAVHGKDDARRIFDSLRWKNDPMAPTTVQAIDQDEGRAARGLPDQSVPRHAALAPLSQRAALEERRQSILLWHGTGPARTPHASNAWLANHGKVSDADAVLVNGPQVGDRIPSMLWGASLHGAGLDVTGMTYAGLPYFHYGTNGAIAWARTAEAGSVIDTYRETLKPDDPHSYRYKGKWTAMQRRDFTVAVRGAPAVTVTGWRTVHGPVMVFDEKNHVAYSKKRSWLGHEVETMLAYYDEMKARDYTQWSAQIARKANNQNQYYADAKGNIAYAQAGFYPLRPKGQDVQLPASGDGGQEWRGIQPFVNNAKVLNPKQGFIANWNNKPSPDIPNSDVSLWSQLHRVDAIRLRLAAKPSLTTQELWDTIRWSAYASEQQHYFAPLLREAVAGLPPQDRVRQVAETIADWDGQRTDPGHSGFNSAPGQTAFYAWLGTALNDFYARDIPAAYRTGCDDESSSVNCPQAQSLGGMVLYFALAQGKTGSPVPPFDFLHGKPPAAFIRETLAKTDAALSKQYGAEMRGWLSKARVKVWDNNSAMGVPWAEPSEKITAEPYQNRGAMNAMYIFRGGKVTMCDVMPPGESGFVAPDGKADPHYADQVGLYNGFGCKPRALTPQDVQAHTVSTQTLTF